MAFKVKGKTTSIVNEVARFKKEEIEFLFELIKNSMIPGKHLGIAMDVVNKLKQQYQLLDKKTAKVQKVESAKSDPALSIPPFTLVAWSHAAMVMMA